MREEKKIERKLEQWEKKKSELYNYDDSNKQIETVIDTLRWVLKKQKKIENITIDPKYDAEYEQKRINKMEIDNE